MYKEIPCGPLWNFVSKVSEFSSYFATSCWYEARNKMSFILEDLLYVNMEILLWNLIFSHWQLCVWKNLGSKGSYHCNFRSNRSVQLWLHFCEYWRDTGVSAGREIAATGIFLYLSYPGMRIWMFIRSTWGLFSSFLYMWYGDFYFLYGNSDIDGTKLSSLARYKPIYSISFVWGHMTDREHIYMSTLFLLSCFYDK